MNVANRAVWRQKDAALFENLSYNICICVKGISFLKGPLCVCKEISRVSKNTPTNSIIIIEIASYISSNKTN